MRTFYAIEYPPIGPVGSRLYADEATAQLNNNGGQIITLEEKMKYRMIDKTKEINENQNK
jgi:hypothetical protein